MTVLYEVTLWLLALLALPKFLYAHFVQKKYQQSFSKRFGKDFPKIEKGDRRLIWIHAVSVGETKAVSALAKSLKEDGNPILIISNVTETGHAEAMRSIPEADYHVFLPFDFYAVIRPIVNRLKPDLVLLTETDFWFNFLRAAKCQGAKIAVVNGKLSERSTARFKTFSFFSKYLFSDIDLFCLQSQLYANRFKFLGVPETKIVVTGNLKFDNHPTHLTDCEKADLRAKLGVLEGDKVVVVGSSHDPEEKFLMTAMQNLLEKEQALKVILVPRHPEKFDLVANWLQNYPVAFQKFSDGEISIKTPIILLDAMGMLGKCYQIADVAIVAGSYIKTVGGHNILEPLWHGVPTIFGPYMHGQPDLVEAATTYRAGLQVPIENLSASIHGLLTGGTQVEVLKQGCAQLIDAMQGSTKRTLLALYAGFGSIRFRPPK